MTAKTAPKFYDSAGNLVLQTYDEGSDTWTPVSQANPMPTREPYVIRQMVVPVTAQSKELVPANPGRKYLLFTVVGTADVTITPGTADAVAGVGLILQAMGVGKQGACQELSHGAPTNAFQVIATAVGSSVIVWEGN